MEENSVIHLDYGLIFHFVGLHLSKKSIVITT